MISDRSSTETLSGGIGTPRQCGTLRKTEDQPAVWAMLPLAKRRRDQTGPARRSSSSRTALSTPRLLARVAVLRLDECQDRLRANTVVFHRLRRLLRLKGLLPVRDVRDLDHQPDPIRSLRISKSAHRHSARPEEFLSLR